MARELDVVIVVSVGNCSDIPIPHSSRNHEDFQRAGRDQLTRAEQRLCNPATAALALTVGAIARNDGFGHCFENERYRPLENAIAASPCGAPSPFTRTGPGYSMNSRGMIKPDLVHYGGNYALQGMGETLRWVKKHYLLGEPTIQKEENGRYLGAPVGTSFATPHVTHAAALALASLEQVLQHLLSANLIRALVGSSALPLPCNIPNWLRSENEALNIIGYGLCSEEDVVASYRHRVRLVAEDSIEEDKLHIYRIPVPQTFLHPGRAKRGITIALAYDPPVRGSRKEYIARTIGFEACCGLTTAEAEQYRARYEGDVPEFPTVAKIALKPANQTVEGSTLQVRHKEWKQKPHFQVADGEEGPVIHLLIWCQQRFPTGLDPQQRYGLVVLFWHENQEVELYQELRAAVSVPVRVRVER